MKTTASKTTTSGVIPMPAASIVYGFGVADWVGVELGVGVTTGAGEGVGVWVGEVWVGVDSGLSRVTVQV